MVDPPKKSIFELWKTNRKKFFFIFFFCLSFKNNTVDAEMLFWSVFLKVHKNNVWRFWRSRCYLLTWQDNIMSGKACKHYDSKQICPLLPVPINCVTWVGQLLREHLMKCHGNTVDITLFSVHCALGCKQYYFQMYICGQVIC